MATWKKVVVSTSSWLLFFAGLAIFSMVLLARLKTTG